MNNLSKFYDAIAGIRNLGDSMNSLAEAFKNASSIVPKKADKPSMIKERKKTKKGAIHKANPTFRARQILAVKPSEYRRRHMGNPYKAMKKMIKEGVLSNGSLQTA